MRLHLMACRPCVRYMQQSEFLTKATQELDEKLQEEVFTGQLSAGARKRIKDILRTALA